MAVVLAGAKAARLCPAERLIELLRRVALAVNPADSETAFVRQTDDLRQTGADGVIAVRKLLRLIAYFGLICLIFLFSYLCLLLFINHFTVR